MTTQPPAELMKLAEAFKGAGFTDDRPLIDKLRWLIADRDAWQDLFCAVANESDAAAKVKELTERIRQLNDAFEWHDMPVPDATALSAQAARLAAAEARIATMLEALEEAAGRLEGFAPRKDAGVIEVVARVLLNIASELRRAAAAIRTTEAARVGETPEGGG